MDNPWGEEPAWAHEYLNEGDRQYGQSDDVDFATWFGAQHVLILLDGGDQNMFQACINHGEQTLSPLDAAILACKTLCRNRVLQIATQKTGKRDSVGVLIYGVSFNKQKEGEQHEDDDEEETITEGKNCALGSSSYMLVELNPPGVQQIQALRSSLDDPVRGRQRDLKQEFWDEREIKTEISKGQHLRSVLQDANKIFTESKLVKKASSKSTPSDVKSIWIFTNEDNPHDSSGDEKRQLTQLIKDIADGGTEILLWPLPKANGNSFDTSLFYRDTSSEIYDGASVLSDFSMEDLLDRIAVRGKKPRRLMSIPLLWPVWKQQNSEEKSMIVDFYKIVQPQKKPQPKWINQMTKQETERVAQTIIKDTGEVVSTTATSGSTNKDRIVHFATFGTDRVSLSPNDVSKIKASSHAGTNKASLIVLGFKPEAALPITNILDASSYLIYPNDTVAPGSTGAFANLHASMLRKNVVAIGELLTRVTACSRLVVLYPQAERRDIEFNDQLIPPGMIVANLPFEDDVRKMNSDCVESIANEESVQKAMDLIRHQKLENVEIGLNFENAALERFWKYVEAVALEMSIPEQEQYETELNEEEVIQAAGHQIASFRDCLPKDIKNENEETEAKGCKRKLISDDSGIDWAQLYKTNALSECKVNELKSYLRSVGARVGGRKEDLVLRVSRSIEDREKKGVFISHRPLDVVGDVVW